MGEKIHNSALAISDMVARTVSAGQSPEAEILGVVADYSLQLSPVQQKILNKLQILALHPELSEHGRKQINSFVENYMKMKRYHDTLNYVGRTIEALSLKKFIEAKSIQGGVQVIK